MEKTLLAMILLIVVLSFSFPLAINSLNSINLTLPVQNQSGEGNLSYNPYLLTNFTSRVVEIKIPAVDNEGNGVMATLKVEVIPGRGRALTNINQILFWVDTQHSIRTALRVAQNITKVDLSKYDVIYSIETNASVIEGPSAGAAITIATIAALTNKTLNKNVTITGTINHDGSIGPVGGIVAKGKAAKKYGMKLFLVPLGQSYQTVYQEVKHCEKYGFMTFCTTEIKPKKVDVAKEIGIEVREVENVQEALKYFVKQ
ncbi:MAG: hypothetical protein J7K98_04005 [Candidatus Aenigmarchaeota archaeon]|nr:hypothetical protein [Candidatus Aenigmarchaeota archaeon]